MEVVIFEWQSSPRPVDPFPSNTKANSIKSNQASGAPKLGRAGSQHDPTTEKPGGSFHKRRALTESPCMVHR